MKRALISILLLTAFHAMAQTPQANGGFDNQGNAYFQQGVSAKSFTIYGNCAGLYVKADGTGCANPGDSGSMTWPTFTGLAAYGGSNNWVTPNFSNVVALWASGACTSGWLKFDGTCSTPPGMVYPGVGIGNSTGSGWGTSYGASNQIPFSFLNISAANLNTLIQGLTGCGTATYVYTPQSSNCLPPSSGTGTVSGQASGVIPLGTSSTAISNQSHLDDGNTVASQITSTEQVNAPGFAATGSFDGYGDYTATGTTNPTAPAANTIRVEAPSSGVTAYVMKLPAAQPTTGNTIYSCTAANPSVCSFVANSTSAMTQIAQQVVSGSSTTAVTFSSIPGTYTSLRIVANGRVSDSNTNEAILVEFNADTGNNYDWSFTFGGFSALTASTAVADSQIRAGILTGATAPANYAGTMTLDIPGYAGTTFYKTTSSQSSWNLDTNAGHLNASSHAGQWHSTAAITQIVLTDQGGGHYLAGTTFTLYGVQ